MKPPRWHPEPEGQPGTHPLPMLWEMTDKWPGVPAGLSDQQDSSLHQEKSTSLAVQNILYSLFFLLYWLFYMFDQHWASSNFDLRTAGLFLYNLSDTLSHVIKRKALIAATSALFVRFYLYYTHYFSIISILFVLRLAAPAERWGGFWTCVQGSWKAIPMS